MNPLRPVILFLKAVLPGSADLFAAPTQVAGYVSKDGTYVAPHTAIRHKRHAIVRPVHQPAQPDLFAAPAKPAAKPAPKPVPAGQADLFAAPPKPQSPAPAKPGKPEASISATTNEAPKIDKPKPTPKPEAPVESKPEPAPAESAPTPPKPILSPPDASPPDASPKSAAPDQLEAFGVHAGIGKAERVKLNAAAVRILDAEPDSRITAADKAVLARYSGNGGCGTSLNEYYTPLPVAAAMWELLERAGFRGGDVLEPSAGTGTFLHTAPTNARVVAVEMDPISSRICHLLHGGHGHEVECASLERFATQDGRLFDAVIGNPPFGKRGGTIADDKKNLASAERYFIDTALDKTKDGGLVALIVPSGVMDSQPGRSFRETVMTKAEFLGGSRMPNTAFEASHTSVTTDVLLFRKRPADVAGALGTLDQSQLRQVGVWDDEFLAGTYFTDGRGAGNVHGTAGTAMREFGPVYTVEGSMVGVPAAVAAMPLESPPPCPSMPQILEALADDDVGKRRAISAALKPPYQVAKLGDVRTVDGIRYILQGEPPRWHRAEEDLHPAVADAMAIGELLDDLHSGAAKDPAFARLTAQEALSDFVAKHGPPARNKPLRAWLAAPSFPNEDGVGPMEHGARVEAAARRTARLLGAVRDDGSYSDLVTGAERKVEVASLDTLATALSLESGGFTPDQLAVASAKPLADVLDHLYASAAYAVEPDGRTWSTMDTYISGDLWARYDTARAAAAAPGADPALVAKWTMQAEALEAAIAPQSLEDVEITTGSGFIKPEHLTAWFKARHVGRGWEPPVITYSAEDAFWSAAEGQGVYGDAKLILQALNRTGVRKVDKEKLERLNQEFATWLRGSEYRDEVEETYNRTSRGFRAKEHPNTPIAIPGMNTEGLKDFQYGGVRWALEAGSGIVAADVGLGKTVRGLMLAKMLKVTGQAEKPVFVVPKSVLTNWMAEAEKWFPGSRVLVIGETYKTDKVGNLTSKPDDAATRRSKYHQLQQNDYDFVFISQPTWNELDVNPVLKGDIAEQDFWNRRGKKLGQSGDKHIQKIRTAHDEALAKKDFADRESTIYFDDLGIDALIMDEGHAYKNLYSAGQKFGETPKFLGASGDGSMRAQDTFFKTKALRDKHDGRGVFMLTATPTKNSPLEVYSMLAQIAPEAFERMGIQNAEDFIDRFCEFTEDHVLTVDGDMDTGLVTSGFKNLDELRNVMRRYIDRKTAEDVGLVIPRGVPVDHHVEMTPAQEQAYEGLREEYRALSDGKGDATGDSHIFSVMARMGKASIDLDLLTGASSGTDMPKVDACAREAMERAAEGGQVIFCDHVETHEKIAAKLVAAGIPRTQIGIINGTATPSSAQRQRLCDQYNSGKIRFMIGNTATMGEGVNLQKGTTDIHHLDLPWEPASIQQRNGRGVRQGNTKEAVRLHSYLAKRSFDGYRWQTVRAKKDWQDLLWNGGDRVENLAAQTKMDRNEQLIAMSNNPEEELAKYQSNKAAAIERMKAEERGKAIELFDRWGKMGRGLAKLRAEQDPLKVQHAAIARLARKHEAAREALRDLRGFDHKHLLDSDTPAVIEPVTGHAWQEGAGLVLAGGDGGPLHYADHDTRWVVTSVDPEAGKVTVRHYGSLSGSKVEMDLAAMKEGVAPFTPSHEEETKLLDDEALAAADLKLAGAEKGGTDLHLDKLRDLGAKVLADRGPQIQAAMKDSIRKYRDGHRSAYGMIDAQGHARVYSSYTGREHLDTHDLILPTAEHKAKAIAAYVHAGMHRGIETHYLDQGRRRSSSYGQTETSIKPRYHTDDGKDAETNPWEHVLGDVFGKEARAEGHRALRDTAHAQVAEAETFRGAVRAASKVADVSPHSWGKSHHAGWPAETVRALAAKARELGVLDTPLHEAAPADEGYRGTELHSKLFHDGGVNYGNKPSAGGRNAYGWGNSAPVRARTVREWLRAISHADDKAALLPPEPEKAAA